VIIIIGGMGRSGSTFSFNVVREVLALNGSVETASANSIESSYFDRTDGQHFILKTHAPDEETLERIRRGSIKCVCTIRRPEDAIASAMRTFGFSLETGIEFIKTWLSWYRGVSRQVLTIDYWLIDLEPRTAIERILEYVGAVYDEPFVDSLERKYEKVSLKRRYDTLVKDDETVDLGFTYYHRETFFHRRHISSLDVGGAEEELSPAQLEQIRVELREFTVDIESLPVGSATGRTDRWKRIGVQAPPASL
jgi:hypothetical protein